MKTKIEGLEIHKTKVSGFRRVTYKGIGLGTLRNLRSKWTYSTKVNPFSSQREAAEHLLMLRRAQGRI